MYPRTVKDILWCTDYWSKRLEETRKELDPFQAKLLAAYFHEDELSTVDMMKLRQGLMEYHSYSTLLAEDLDRFRQEQQKEAQKPLWKKLLKK